MDNNANKNNSDFYDYKKVSQLLDVSERSARIIMVQPDFPSFKIGQVGNVADYARDMYEDGECAYKWRDGLTEWQHISASIRSGNTEYIYAWLRDLQLELPYLKDNRNFSVTEALNHLDNYEKQYMGKLSIDELKKGTRLV